MNIIELAKQAGFELDDTNDLEPESILYITVSTLQTFAELIIKQHEDDNPVIITDNTKTIANMEARIAELEVKLAIAIDALEFFATCEFLQATEALTKIKGVMMDKKTELGMVLAISEVLSGHSLDNILATMPKGSTPNKYKPHVGEKQKRKALAKIKGE